MLRTPISYISQQLNSPNATPLFNQPPIHGPTSCHRKHRLVQDINHLLVDRPRPRQRAHASPVLQRLIDEQADPDEDQVGKGPANPVTAHQRPDHARRGALSVMHRHVEAPELRVGRGPHRDEPLEGARWHVGVGSGGEELFGLFG